MNVVVFELEVTMHVRLKEYRTRFMCLQLSENNLLPILKNSDNRRIEN